MAGLVTTQAIGIGLLLYIVLWEGFFTGFVSGARVLSIRAYCHCAVCTEDERRFASSSHMSLVLAIAVSVVVFGGFLFRTIRRLRRMGRAVRRRRG